MYPTTVPGEPSALDNISKGNPLSTYGSKVIVDPPDTDVVSQITAPVMEGPPDTVKSAFGA
jgi:hypothetical protein